MPLQGVFNADFTAFTTACAQAEASLKAFETDANKTEAALNRMADSVSGQKIVQQAYLATKAVEDVGGAAVLTEKELARMSAIAAEGAEKLRAMGQDVPAQMQKLADETNRTAEALSTAQGYLAAFGITASISGIVSFTKSIFDSASAIHDMAERLGISAEAVQGFKFAAEQAGSSLDAVGSAITKMNKNLAEGNKETLDALQKLGLEYQAIRNMKPEEAFLAITDAVAKLPDPMERSEVALRLFGKGAADLLPAITEGFRAAADGAQKMSNDTIDALERAQDAWTKLGNSVTIISGTIIAGTIDATTHVTSSWQNFWQFVKDSASMGVGAAAALATMNERIKETVEFVGPLEKGLHATKEEIDASKSAAKNYAAAWTELNSIGRSYQQTIAGINPKIAEHVEYYLKAGASQSTLATAYRLTEGQVNALADRLKDYGETLKAVQKIEGDHLKQAETNYLGLSKAETDRSQQSIENFGKANDQIMAMNQRLTDDYNKQTMDRGTFENLQLWKSADAQIAAFQKTGVTAQQVAEFSDQVYEHTAIKAGEIQYTAATTLTNITDEGIRDMLRLVAAQEKAVADAAQASTMAIQTMQGGAKVPGSTIEQAFGQNYLVTSTGARIPVGPHGEIPKNFDDLYYGRSNFPQFAAGVSNFAGGLAVVGERGPELVNLPAGSDVLPGGFGASVVNHIYVNGTAADVARQVAAEIMRTLKSTQQLTLR